MHRRDHARDPRQRPRLEHADADQHPAARSAPSCRSTRTSRTCNGDDGKKLSKRHGAVVGRRVPRRRLPAGGADQLPRAARLELRRQDDDHVAPRADRALLARPRRAEPGDLRLREARLDERRLPARPAAGRVRARPAHVAARAGDRLAGGRACARRCRSSRRRSRSSRSTRTSSASCSSRSRRRTAPTRRSAAPPPSGSQRSSRGRPRRSRRRCARSPRSAGLKPRDAFAPIRLAVTGLEGLARAVREHRAARPRGEPRAARRAAAA